MFTLLFFTLLYVENIEAEKWLYARELSEFFTKYIGLQLHLISSRLSHGTLFQYLMLDSYSLVQHVYQLTNTQIHAILEYVLAQ